MPLVRRLAVPLLLALGFAAPAGAQTVTPDLRVNFEWVVDVNADLTYVKTWTVDQLIDAGSIATNHTSEEFDPKVETLDLIEAWTDQPGGTRLTVAPADVFTRPSEASKNAPGFVGTMTTTALFPQVQLGSRLHAKWRLTVKTPSPTGVSEALSLWPGHHTRMKMTVNAPTSVPLHWAQRGGIAVTDGTSGAVRTIAAEISEPTEGPAPEPNSVSNLDVEPVFVVTTLQSYEQYGTIYNQLNAGKADATPELRTLAQQIVGDKAGLDAVRAIYDWVAGNIHYVAVWLDPDSGLVAHSAAEVLANGYGDCKDHVVLLQALMGAVGIKAVPTLVNWDNRMKPLPSWSDEAFNHVIAYLPDFDIYLNPIDGFARFEDLDALLSGKLVVLATNPGEVRQTPASRPGNNPYRLEAALSVSPDGTIVGKSMTEFSARSGARVRRSLSTTASFAQRVNQMLSATPEGGFGAIGLLTGLRDLTRPLRIAAEWTSPGAVDLSGDAAYFTVPVGVDFQSPFRMRDYLSPTGARRFPMLIGVQDSHWRFQITLPQGFALSEPPKDVSVRNDAGHFQARYDVDGGVLKVDRQLVLEHDVYEAADYPDVQTLLYAQLADLRRVLVLRRADAEAADEAVPQ